mmetsp:Transcript_26154/g.72136  ORF Transcript_26154/g.72136 Transcript_26154/m.72136 type:complete len:257 (+) Transcript_26154:3690-4460(+)
MFLVDWCRCNGNLSFTTRLQSEFLHSFPGKIRIISSEMSIGSRLSQNGATQVEVPNDATRSEIKVLIDDGCQIGIRHSFLDRSIRIDKDGQRIGDTNGIRQLNQGSLAQFGSHQGFGNPPGGIGCRAINLGRVFARKCSTPMSPPASIRIDNDFPSRQTSVSMGTTNDKTARRIQVINGFFVQILFGDHRFDHVFHQVGGNLFLRNIFRMLRRNDNGVNTLGDGHSIFQLVLARDLRFSIRSHPVQSSILSHFGEF